MVSTHKRNTAPMLDSPRAGPELARGRPAALLQ